MIKNRELELALDFIERTDRNLFITGKAGTGKTTFLHKIKETSLKRMVVVAPTGVAAINAKGVTIHSFFQMPFGPILPDQSQNSIQRKFSRTKIDIIKSLDLVIIDEISMVRADLLDGIDQVLRRYKNRNLVFGGAQVVMIGDLQQLSPVVKPNEYNLLKNYYQTMYFFSSKAFQQANALSIELKHIYRQENEEFITILNEIRNDELTQASQDRLNQRFNPNFEPNDDAGYITLTTHNRKANSINESKLAKLENESHFFKAEIEGNFSETAFPNSEVVELKVGAQVMFIKNDSSPEKRYFNGKIGVIVHIDEDTVTVQCPNEDDAIETSYERWDNVKYSLNEETNEISEEIAGIFSQMPLRLAWAITIHKSQGLTFDKAIIDAGASFAHGQTYVALSRCTSLEGIVLKTQIGAQSIINDGTVKSFSDEVAANEPDQEVLTSSEKSYQLNLMAEIFSFQSLLYPTQRMMDIYYKNRSTLEGNVLTHLEVIKDKGVVQLMKVAASFQKQLQQLDSETPTLAEENQKIQERFQKAIGYFKEQSAEYIQQPLNTMTFSSDNKAVKKEFKKQFDTLFERMTVKQYVLKNLTKFGVQEYLKVRSDAVLQESEAPKKRVLKPKGDSVLAVRLRELRDDIATAENVPHFQVFTQEALYGICEALPRTAAQLKKVKGMGKIRVRKYGEEIIEVVESYCKEKGLEDTSEPLVEVEKKPSHQISLELFKQGFSIKEIAKERSLTQTTIESHLAKYIPSGDIDILELIPLKRYQKLVKEIESIEFSGLKDLKTALDDSYSYMEIKMTLSSLEL
mmetsp:Transcript_32957/g.47729  ORF Transcript_32957/g.47729 Transcript_32957/m.47729 type:complete len:801 (-) Transcript_32957:191-2593(-)